MPAATGPALTRSDIESWSVDHLETAATHWTMTAQHWESHFETMHNGMSRPGGTIWEGGGADAASERSWADLVKVRGGGDALHTASGVARNGAGDVAWAKRQTLTAIADAEEAGFTVDEDLSVRDRSVFGPPSRQQQAVAHAHAIQAAVQKLVAADKAVAAQITSTLAPLHDLQFPEDSKHAGDPTVQAVDYGFKQSPPPPGPGLPQPPGGWSDDPVMDDAQHIAYGHAWEKHSTEFPGMTQDQLAQRVHDMLTGDPRSDPSLHVGAIPGRTSTAIYKDGILVIHDPLSGDGGTVYKPTGGFDEFLRLIGGAGAAAPVISAPPNLPPTVPHPVVDPLPPTVPHAPVSLPPPAFFDPNGLPPWLANPSAPATPVSPSGPLIFPNTPLPSGSPPIPSPGPSLFPHVDLTPSPNLGGDLAAAGRAEAPAVAGGLSLAAILGLLLVSPG